MKPDIEKIVRHRANIYQPKKITFFGSYAYGKPDAGSDLDLLIIKKTSERFIVRYNTKKDDFHG